MLFNSALFFNSAFRSLNVLSCRLFHQELLAHPSWKLWLIQTILFIFFFLSVSIDAWLAVLLRIATLSYLETER